MIPGMDYRRFDGDDEKRWPLPRPILYKYGPGIILGMFCVGLVLAFIALVLNY